MKHVFIVNPSAGGGKALEIGQNIEKVCLEENLEYILHYTKAPKEATAITKTYKKDANIIYSVGGDGTLSEIVNGIVGTKNRLAIIPAGHGNDFYKSILRLDEENIKIDVGQINGTYFINVVSFGIDAEVGSNANIFKHKKLVPKKQIYNASIIYTLAKYQFKKIEFNLNDIKMAGEYTIVAICNGGYYGNGYRIAPHAKLDDGLFDIYFIDRISKTSIMKLVPKLKRGTHEKDPRVNKKQASSIKVKTDLNMICQVDGEVLNNNKFKIKIVPEALTIYNNRELINKFLI